MGHFSLHTQRSHIPKLTNKMAGAKDDTKPKKVNGLTKPMTLSKELAAIVDAKKDEKLARSEIIKRLWAYLKKENLQHGQVLEGAPLQLDYTMFADTRVPTTAATLLI